MSNLEAIRKKLVKRREELLALEAISLNKLRVADDTVKDPADEAFSITQEEIGISLYNNELAEYKRINKAIEMIDNGTYGICAECSKLIAEKRLTVYPNASRCLPCQEIFEAEVL